MHFRLAFVIPLLVATSASADQEETVPRDFLGGGPNVGSTPSIRTSDLPVFPELGNASADVTVDYFYAYDCEGCPAASRAVRQVLEEDLGVNVVFHPIGRSQDAFDAAIAETVAFSVSPGLFQYVHFGSMIGTTSEDAFNFDRYLQDIVSMSDNPDTFWTRIENYRDWSTSIDLNSKMADHFDASELPFFVIDGAKFEGAPDPEALKTQILISKGKKLEDSMSASSQ